MSDAMQLLAVAGVLLSVAQVIAKLPGGRKSAAARPPAASQAVHARS